MTGDVIGEVNYLTTTKDGVPAWLEANKVTGKLATNYGHEPTRVTIHDLRGKEDTVDLDTNAVAVMKYEGSMQEMFEGGSEAQRAHYDEIADIVKKHLSASRVFVYHHAFRNRGTASAADQLGVHRRNPDFVIHCDIDGPGVRAKMKQVLGEEEAEKAMKNRYIGLNIWRPLGPNAITERPLAICDYRSVDVEKDIHPLAVRESINTATANTISPGMKDAHQWYYLSNMRSNEMFIFKMFDSKSDVAQTAFHTAFLNPNGAPSTGEQKSVEMRCIVLFDHQ